MEPPIATSRPVVAPAAPRLTTLEVKLGVNGRVAGPVRLNAGELTVTAALLVPTRWYLAGWCVPEQVRLVPPPQVSALTALKSTTSPAQAPAPDRTIVPK